jgi:hypothetical protein
MKQLVRFLIAISLLPIPLWPQALPDAPSPAAPDPAWNRLKNVAIGTPLLVGDVDNVSVHCLFAGVTDAHLFCNPAGNPLGVGYRFDRDRVLSVDFDRPGQTGAQFAAPQRNYHPAWIASILAGGLIVGICATRTMNDGDSARAGGIGALVVAVVGAPLAFLPHSDSAGFGLRPQPFAGPRIPIIAFPPHRLSRSAGAR